MKDNYYKLRASNNIRKRKTSSKKRQANMRKRKAKKLNYKKVFAFFFTIFLIIFTINGGFGKLFSGSKKPVNSAPEPQPDITINIAVVGDIMCHSTNFQDAYDKETDTYDFTRVFTDVKDYIQNADIAVGNLETTFAGKDAGYSGYPTFNTPEQLAQNIKDLGIDVVSTANNHSLDKRLSGLLNTLNVLDKVGLSHTGTFRSKEEQDNILVKDVNGIKIAFLSFTYGTNGIPVPSGKEYCINLIDEDLIKDQIVKAKAKKPDLICVSMHWGEEYKLKQNEEQEKLANFLFDNGVDIILGSHPHVLEPMEKRTIKYADGRQKDGFVIYSLGNFMSGQVAENTMNTIILYLKITKHADNTITIDSNNYIPIYMYDKGAGSKERYKILDINKTINSYNNGNKFISEASYNKIKAARDKIDKIMGTTKKNEVN